MKKILIILVFIVICVCIYVVTYGCRVLPKDTDCELMFNNRLYKLTARGLVELGCVYDIAWGLGYPDRPLFSKTQKILYFDGCVSCGVWINTSRHGIYKLDLNKPIQKPELVLKTYRWPTFSSISPDGNLLLFTITGKGNDNDLSLLNLATGKLQKLIEDYYYVYKSVWINDHQFVYCSTKINEVSKKHLLFLYDISSKTKKDLHLDGYYPGSLTPDGKELVLSGNDNTIFYNISDKSIKVLEHKEMRITNMIWLPDSKGFLYSDQTFLLEVLETLGEGYGLYYYSVEKKRSVRLSKLYDLSRYGGFVVPPGLNLKLPDTKLNREISAPGYENKHLIKLCK